MIFDQAIWNQASQTWDRQRQPRKTSVRVGSPSLREVEFQQQEKPRDGSGLRRVEFQQQSDDSLGLAKSRRFLGVPPQNQQSARPEEQMTQSQVRQTMAPQGQAPSEFISDRDRMANFLNSQLENANRLASGEYSPSRDAMREYAKQMAARTRGNIGLTSEGSSAGRASRSAAAAMVPGAMGGGIRRAGITDRLQGIQMQQDLLAGRADFAGAGLSQDLARQGYEDWLSVEGAKLQAQGLSDRLANEQDILRRQLEFSSGGLPGFRYDQQMGANQYVNQMNRMGNLIAGAGNMLASGVGMYGQLQPSNSQFSDDQWLQDWESGGTPQQNMQFGVPQFNNGSTPWFLGD